LKINGNDGPTLKKIFSCEGCKFLSDSPIYKMSKIKNGNKHKCFHPDVIDTKNRIFLMIGDISDQMITPSFCPFMIKKSRTEKLKELNNSEVLNA
jgi:hypothetical protein